MSTTTSPGPATGSGASPYTNFSGPPWPVSNTAFIERLLSYSSHRRRDRQTAGDAVPLDQAGDDTRAFRLLDKLAQKGKAGGVLFRGADGLLDRGELAVEDARARKFRGDIDETRPQPGIGVHLLVLEGLDRGVGAVELQEFALLEVVFEPQPIGAARGHRGALAGLVDLADQADRGTRRHQIGSLDLAIGGGEVDDRRALRLGADIADVPEPFLGIVRDLAR